MHETPNSRLEVAEQWSREHDTQLNEMPNRRRFLTHIHTHTLLGISGSGVAWGRSTVKWVKALFLFRETLSASISRSPTSSLSLIKSLTLFVSV